MYTTYANEISEEDLLYLEPERTSDIQLPPVMNTLLLAIWIAISLFGFGVIFLGKMPILGTAIIGVPTFLGMVIRPTFALCILMLVLPTGAGIGIEGFFSLNRGIGIAVAISFALNLLISRPRLRIRNKALWVMALFTFWTFFTPLVSPYPELELRRSFSYFQLLALAFIVYWIVETNGEKTLIWMLRSYVVGSLGTIMITFITGAAMRSMTEIREQERYGATLGRVINQNMLAALVAMAFLAAIYLLIRDKNIFWRVIYLIAIGFLPMMMLRIGSRGALIALTFTMISPLLFIAQIWRRPTLAVLLAVVIVLASVSMALLVRKQGLRPGVYQHLTEPEEARTAINYRMMLNKAAIHVALRKPMGSGELAWFEEARVRHYPHNDFLRTLGFYGMPGAILFVALMVTMIFTVKRMPLGVEKLYARAVLTFLLVMGLGTGQLTYKYFWLFLAVIMAIGRISWLYSGTSTYITEEAGQHNA